MNPQPKAARFHFLLQENPGLPWQHMGTALRSGKTDHRHSWPPQAEHFFCPVCGRVWLKVIPEDISPTLHKPRIMPCPQHGPGWCNFTAKELAELPPRMLKREAELAAQDPSAWAQFYRGKLPYIVEL